MMFTINHHLMIEAIFRLRRWVQENLPIENSLIAYDLILLLSIHNYSNGRITVKQLFGSLPHSPTAIRSHYQRFLDDGWIELSPDPNDRRIRYVQPTKKFIDMMNTYTDVAGEIFVKQVAIKP
jgi:DNA-binding MarR family transcriptional regulator